MSSYHLLTIWHLRVPRQPVWEVLSQPAQYGEWWPSFVRYWDLTPGHRGVGQRDHRWVRGHYLPLLLRFSTEIIALRPPEYVRYQAEGDLAGWGQVHLTEEGASTCVVITWRVMLAHRWMRIFQPVLRRLLIVNHEAVMRQGQRGLARRLHTSGRTDAISIGRGGSWLGGSRAAAAGGRC